MRQTTSIAVILMVLTGISSAQAPAQMEEKIKSDAVLIQDQMAKVDYLQERNAELERLLKAKQAEIDRLNQACPIKPLAPQAVEPDTEGFPRFTVQPLNQSDSTKVPLTRFRFMF